MIGGALLVLIGLVWTLTDLSCGRSEWCIGPGGVQRTWRGRLGPVLVVIGVLVLSLTATAAPQKAAAPAPAAVRIPEASAMYRRWVEQAVTEEWGVDGSPARLAAQIHAESSWNAKARSPVGAEGLTQFMPATSKWIADKFPDKLGGFDPWDPQQAALAAAIYDRWLADRNPGTGACSTWSFALSAYNGGEGRLHAEQLLASKAGRDRGRWFGHVADMRARSPDAWRENRTYVHRILTVLEPAYINAGWAGKAACV
ncbi:transglycosylase SLT domain-containing protein [Dyella sp. 2RAB6]|uniref:transglycosylase SLT domain-containing protein n=1 Tax=Dyella sp. 2RAB6 TaxID=3232992 RepID=UPI003F8DAA80